MDSKDSYDCKKCEDTTWLVLENGAVRCGCYQKKIMVERWKRFGVDPERVKLIRDYEPNSDIRTRARNLAIEYIKQFDNTNTSRDNSIAFMGQPGSGKTHLSLAIGKALLEQGQYSVTYMPYLEAIRELKMNTLDDERYYAIQNRYINSKVLIIDDLFKDKVKQGRLIGELTEADLRHIYPIINQRYIDNKPTVFSTECTPEGLLNLDEALAGRILEQCGDNVVVFKQGKENNWRLR